MENSKWKLSGELKAKDFNSGDIIGSIVVNGSMENVSIDNSNKVLDIDNPANLQHKKEENKQKEKPSKKSCKFWNWFKNYWYILIITFLVLSAITLFALLPVMQIKDNYISEILAFVGILATFIVVGNYAQVKDIENKFDKKEDEIREKIEKSLRQEFNQNIAQTYYEIADEKNYILIAKSIKLAIQYNADKTITKALSTLTSEICKDVKLKHKIPANICQYIRDIVEPLQKEYNNAKELYDILNNELSKYEQRWEKCTPVEIINKS